MANNTNILLIESNILIDIQNGKISDDSIEALKSRIDIISNEDKARIKRNIFTVASKYHVLEDKSLEEIKTSLEPMISKIQPIYNFNLDFVVDFMSISRVLEKDDIEISKKIELLRACMNNKSINDLEIEVMYYRRLLNMYLSTPDIYMDEIREYSTLLKTKYKEEL